MIAGQRLRLRPIRRDDLPIMRAWFDDPETMRFWGFPSPFVVEDQFEQDLAGRFAAKEAAMKALGTGHSRGVLWKDIEVVRCGGPPRLQLHGGAARRAAEMNVRGSLLTITHSDTLALAQVMLLGD